MLAPWNAVRFDPSRPPRAGHVESYFFKLNDPTGQRALWLKATILARPGGQPLAEAWAISFERGGGHRAAKQVVPIGTRWSPAVSFSASGLEVQVARVSLREGALEGELAHPSRLRFSLRYEGPAEALVPFPSERLYTGAFPRSKLVSPHPDVRFTGWYEVEGQRVEVEGWRGMQGHNWGRSHAHRYTWAHCNQFTGHDGTIFEGLTGQVRVGPVVTPPVTIVCLRHRGVRYDWNRPLDWVRASAACSVRAWRFAVESEVGSLRGELEATTDEMVALAYENPVGPTTWCLNSKLASARLEFHPRGRPPMTLESRAAALEIGTTETGHGVPVYL